MSPAWFRDYPNIHGGRLHRRGSLALHTSPWPPADPPTGTPRNGKRKKGVDSTDRSVAGWVEQLPPLFETLSLGRRKDHGSYASSPTSVMRSRRPDPQDSGSSSSSDLSSERYPLRSRTQSPYSDSTNNDDDDEDENAAPEDHWSPLDPSPPTQSTKSQHTIPSHHPAQNINMTVNLTLPSSTTISTKPHSSTPSSPLTPASSAPSRLQTSRPDSSVLVPATPPQRTRSSHARGDDRNIHVFTGRRGIDVREELNHLRASRAAITDQLERATKLNREMRERFADPVAPAAVPSGVGQTSDGRSGSRSGCANLAGIAGLVVCFLVLAVGLWYLYDCMTSPAAQYARKRECLEFGLEPDC